MKGQMPGTTRGGAHTKSAINNNKASGYVRARARGIGVRGIGSRVPVLLPNPRGV